MLSIRVRIMAVIIAITAIIVAISLGIGMVVSQKRFMETIEATLVSVSKITSGMISSEISRLKEETLLIAEQINHTDKEEIQLLLDDIINIKQDPSYLTLSILNKNNELQFAGNRDARPLVHLLEAEYIQRCFNGEIIITSTTVTPEDSLIMRIWTPINQDNVLIASLPGLYLSEFISPYRMWQTGNILIIDCTGVCIAENKDYFRVLEQHNYVDLYKTDAEYNDMGQAFQSVIANDNGIETFYLEGTEQLCAYNVIDGTDHWSVAVAASMKESPVTQVKYVLLICIIICMGLGIIAALLSANSIAAPYEKMAELRSIAEAASKSKTKFLANMSHEMRTPLNAIIGISELELQKPNITGENFSNLEKIYSAGITLLGIINDILDISKIESGKIVMVPVGYDMASVINDIISQNIIRIGSKPIQFRLHLKGDLPAQMKGDELRVKQIFNNLLSNAFKYTDSGFVDWTISHEFVGNQIKVISTIADSGKGIRRDDIHKLFREDYYQANLQDNYYIEGTGLGLSITNNLVKLMNGSISLKSEYGKGSVFTVEFYQDIAGDATLGEETANNLSEYRYSAQRRNQNQQIPRADMSYARVLVVDDVTTNLEITRGMLKPYGLIVDCVKSGEEAVRQIREEKVRYNAIFMDHMMPGMDGIEATRIIRNQIKTEYAQKVPIIALTANTVLGNDTIFLDNGFQAFLSKPIDILRLNNILNTWVRDKKFEKKQAETEETQAEKTGRSNDITIPGLNSADALARLDNDVESYVKILRSYIKHIPEFIKTIRSSFPGNIKDYQIAVHAIKGSSRGIGAEELGNMAEKLEMAAKQGDETSIQNNTPPFLDLVEKFMDKLAEFIDSEDAKNTPDS